jgi:hypothetical protein
MTTSAFIQRVYIWVYFSSKIISNQKKYKTKAILKEAHDKVRDLSHELLPSLLAFRTLLCLMICAKKLKFSIQFEYSSTIDEKTR